MFRQSHKGTLPRGQCSNSDWTQTCNELTKLPLHFPQMYANVLLVAVPKFRRTNPRQILVSSINTTTKRNLPGFDSPCMLFRSQLIGRPQLGIFLERHIFR
jgi:hypothetical protein